MTPLGSAARAPAPACPARPRRAHANAGTQSRGHRGVRGARDQRPRSGQAARRHGAGAQGGARTEQGGPGPRSASPLSPPPAGGKATTATSASGRPSAGHTQRPRRRPPGARVVDRPHPGRAGPGEPPVPGIPAYLGASAAALSRAGAQRWRPLRRGGRAEGERRQGRWASGRAGFLHCLNSAPPAPRRDTPARTAAPAPRPPAPPCHSPGAHTPPAPLARACTHAADHASLGFVSVHTHVLTRIPSLHTPSLAPFPPYFLDESPIQLPHFAGLPRTNLLPFPSKPPPTLNCPLPSKHGALPAQRARESFFPTEENELCCPSTVCKGKMLLPTEGSNAFWE